MGAFPPGQVPDFKATAAADKRDLALQFKRLAKFIRKKKAALFIGGAMLGLGMKLAEIDAEIARRNARNFFGGGANPLELVRRHDEQKLPVGFRDHDELVDRAIAPPARRDGDAMFVVDLMTEFAGIEV